MEVLMMTLGDMTMVEITTLAGKTLDEIASARVNLNYDEQDAVLILAGGQWFAMTHSQDCCESVWLEERSALGGRTRGATIRVAEERSDQRDESDSGGSSETWTFYEIRTDAEDITIRWHGASNGYYSESAALYVLEDGWSPSEPIVSWFDTAEEQHKPPWLRP